MSKPEVVYEDQIFPLDVPVEIAQCQYCEGRQALFVSGAESWERDEETGLWFATGIDLCCPNDKWLENLIADKEDDSIDHSYMPYVNWLPECQKTLDWMQKHYAWDLDREQRERSLKPCDFLEWPEPA